MNTRSKSGLFLIELTLVILIFALSAAACLNIFFKSRQIAAESVNLSRAAMEVQSVADCYKSAGGDLLKTAELAGGELREDGLWLYFDGDWQPSETPSMFTVSLISLSEGASEGVVSAKSSSGVPIFSITVRGGLNLG